MKTVSRTTTLILIGASEVRLRPICTPEAIIPRMASFWGHNSNPIHGLQRVNKIVSMGRTSGKSQQATLSQLLNSQQDSYLNTLTNKRHGESAPLKQ